MCSILDPHDPALDLDDQELEGIPDGLRARIDERRRHPSDDWELHVTANAAEAARGCGIPVNVLTLPRTVR